ncbi:MAG TPA: hypothetical protein VFM58_02090 [Solirubrobacteraceae bacterium]|nr:hypothetical protein [Solirubrobacteraceae bacterium]
MSRNVSGQAYALTVLTPIKDGHAQPLAEHLNTLGDGDASPLARVPGTHIARWVVIDELKFQGHGQRHHDTLSAPRLLFSSNFDGDVDVYLEGLRTGMAAEADAIWGHCRDYPGHGNAGTFRAYMRAHQLEAALFFAAYGDQTVGEVKANVAQRRRLIDFALAGQGLDAATLKSRFLETF